MSYPVDVEIYLAKMSEALNDDLAHQHVFEDYGIEDFKMFDELVMNEVTLMCLDNYNLTGDVELSEDQFVRAMEIAIAQYYIDSLVDEGKIEAVMDFDTFEVKYKMVDSCEN
jgi:hypothetical protein